MKLIKMLGAAFLSCAALVGVGANAQQTGPVACSWWTISSQGHPFLGDTRYIHQECRESNGNVVARRDFVWSEASGGLQSCSMSPASGISYTGDCLGPVSPSFFRTVTPPNSSSSSSAPSCRSGVVLGQACQYTRNGYGSWQLTAPPSEGAREAVCGDARCPLNAIEKGYNSQCLPGSVNQQFNNPIVEFTCR